jgi:hypothetical protein
MWTWHSQNNSSMRDFLLKNGDLQIENGDFVIGESDLQNVYLLMILHKGNLKHEPFVGAGIETSLNGSLDGAMRQTVQKNIESDGYKIQEFVAQDEKIYLKIL